LILFSAAFPENGPLDRLDPRLYPESDSLTKSGRENVPGPCYALDYDYAKTILYCGAGNRVYINDVLNPKKPANISDSIILDDQVYDIKFLSNALYIAGGKSGLEIWDVVDPVRPRKMSSLGTRSAALSVALSDSFACVAVADSGLTVVDISNAAEPKELGSIKFPGIALDVCIAGQYAYVADYDSGIRIVSLENPGTPSEAGRLAGTGHAVGIKVSGDLAYLADLEGFRIIRVKDQNNPVEVEFYKTPDMARELFVVYPYVYVACGRAGLRIINVSDPLKPVEAGFFNTPGNALSVKVSGDYAYIGEDRGFAIQDIANPSGKSRYVLPVMLLIFTMVGFSLFF